MIISKTYIPTTVKNINEHDFAQKYRHAYSSRALLGRPETKAFMVSEFYLKMYPDPLRLFQFGTNLCHLIFIMHLCKKKKILSFQIKYMSLDPKFHL